MSWDEAMGMKGFFYYYGSREIFCVAKHFVVSSIDPKRFIYSNKLGRDEWSFLTLEN